MAQVIKSLKKKLETGAYGDKIPFGADGVNINITNVNDGVDLETVLGVIKLTAKGNVQKQLDDLVTSDETINNLITTNKEELQKLIDAANEAISDLETNKADNSRIDELVKTWTAQLANYVQLSVYNTKMAALDRSINGLTTDMEDAQNDISLLQTAMGNKANLNNVYTKSQIDSKLANRFEWTLVQSW